MLKKLKTIQNSCVNIIINWLYFSMLTSVMLRWNGSGCKASRLIWWENGAQLAHRLPNICCCLFKEILENGDHGTSLTCRPVLTQLLVPKTTRENGEKSSALNTPTAASENSVSCPSLRQCCYRLWDHRMQNLAV